jgi:enamine deaminase RidA (YjgF/YER057c/UK114 family)
VAELQRIHLRPEGEKAFGYAQAVKAGGFIHLAGTLSVDDAFAPLHAGDMAAQIDAVYETIRHSLAGFGATMADVVKETIFVTDMDAFLAANERRIRAYEGSLPAATAVEVRRLAFPECLIEVEAVAASC